jgi:hypothetical protein
MGTYYETHIKINKKNDNFNEEDKKMFLSFLNRIDGGE